MLSYHHAKEQTRVTDTAQIDPILLFNMAVWLFRTATRDTLVWTLFEN